MEVLSYEQDDLLDQAMLGNGLLADWNYDVRQRHLTEIRYDDGGSPWARVVYPALDEHGNVLREERWGAHLGGPSIEKDHTYDSLDRLVTSRLKHPSANVSETYGYSPAGNVVEAAGAQYHYEDPKNPQAVTRVEDGSKTTHYKYDADGWLEQVQSLNAATGETETRELDFDGAGCLRTVETRRESGGVLQTHHLTEHVCGPQGSRVLRISKDLLSGRTERVATIPEVGEVRPDEGVLLRRPAVAGTIVVEEARDLSSGARIMSESGYVMQDARGSVLLRTPLWGANQALDREAEYDAWGNRVAVSALPAPRRGFVDAEPDPTDGYLHYGRRVYDPKLRRWLSPDPLLLTAPEIDLGNGQQLNLYSYAANNPVKRIDVHGMFSLREVVQEAGDVAASAAGTVTSYWAGTLDGAFTPVPMKPMKGHERAYGLGLIVGSTVGAVFDRVVMPTLGAGGGLVAGIVATCSGGPTCAAAPAGALAGAGVGAVAGGMVGAHLSESVHEPNFDRGQQLFSEGGKGSGNPPPDAKGAWSPGTASKGGGLADDALKHLTSSQQKSIRSLEQQIAKHQQKLADFRANPTVRPGMEGLPADVIKAQQATRIRHLETEIRTFKNNIQKILNGEL